MLDILREADHLFTGWWPPPLHSWSSHSSWYQAILHQIFRKPSKLLIWVGSFLIYEDCSVKCDPVCIYTPVIHAAWTHFCSVHTLLIGNPNNSEDNLLLMLWLAANQDQHLQVRLVVILYLRRQTAWLPGTKLSLCIHSVLFESLFWHFLAVLSWKSCLTSLILKFLILTLIIIMVST